MEVDRGRGLVWKGARRASGCHRGLAGTRKGRCSSTACHLPGATLSQGNFDTARLGSMPATKMMLVWLLNDQEPGLITLLAGREIPWSSGNLRRSEAMAAEFLVSLKRMTRGGKKLVQSWKGCATSQIESFSVAKPTGLGLDCRRLWNHSKVGDNDKGVSSLRILFVTL